MQLCGFSLKRTCYLNKSKREKKMILSNGRHVELKSLDNGTLIKEERTFFNMYKNSTVSSLSSLNKQKYVSAYENEIKMFNQWQNLVFEIFKREKIKGEIRR